MKNMIGEKKTSSTAAKDVYFYVDKDKGIYQLSREVYKNKEMVVHYPRGFDGGARYKNIRRMVFVGYGKQLPVGVYKAVQRGWGFTRGLKSFAKYADDVLQVTEVVIDKDGDVAYEKSSHRLVLSDSSMTSLQKSLSVVFKKYKSEEDLVLMNILHSLFPNQVAKPKKTYVPNALAASLSSWGNSVVEFSPDDKAAIRDLFEKLSIGTDFLTQQTLTKTKEIVDNKYIQETLDKYKKLMKSGSESNALEKRWQRFLKENSWIFSSIFAQPVILHKDEAYVGGKSIDNVGGKLNDFLIKNSLSNNVSFLEIKTHMTTLTESKSYRGEDVYSSSKELTGCMVQVLNQRDNFQKEFTNFFYKNKDKPSNIETFNSRCVVLIGTVGNLTVDQRNSFELFRSNSRDVEVLTFDELQKKIESLQQLIANKVNATGAN